MSGDPKKWSKEWAEKFYMGKWTGVKPPSTDGNKKKKEEEYALKDEIWRGLKYEEMMSIMNGMEEYNHYLLIGSVKDAIAILRNTYNTTDEEVIKYLMETMNIKETEHERYDKIYTILKGLYYKVKGTKWGGGKRKSHKKRKHSKKRKSHKKKKSKTRRRR